MDEIRAGLDKLAAMPWPDRFEVLLAPVLAGFAIVLLIAAFMLRRWPRKRGRIALFCVLGVTAVGAVFNYYYVQYASYRTWVNPYEFFHYYLGAKYAHEVGYVDLYNATIIADGDTGLKYSIKSGDIRNLRTGRWIAYRGILDNREDYTGKFSEARWSEFVQDVQYFKAHLTEGQWNMILTDKGYNGTPVWGMVAGPLANYVPTDCTLGMTALASLDAALLLLALGAVWWAFGAEAMLFTTLFLGTHMLMSHTHMKGAFLRTDWVVALVIATCLIRKGWLLSAGCLTACAALSRVFPVVFVFGIGAKLLGNLAHGFWARKRGHATAPEAEHATGAYAAHLWTFVITCAALFGASVIYYGGPAIWTEYLDKIVRHNETISAWRVGFKYVFMWSLRTQDPGQSLLATFASHQHLWWSIQGVVLVVCTLCAWRLEDDEAMALGFVPFYFLVAPTYYYYIILLVPFLFFVSRIERPTRAFGAIVLFAASIAAHVLYGIMGRSDKLFLVNSCLYGGIAVYMLLLCVLPRGKRKMEQAHHEDGKGMKARTG